MPLIVIRTSKSKQYFFLKISILVISICVLNLEKEFLVNYSLKVSILFFIIIIKHRMVILVPAKKLYITFEDMGLQTFVLATEIVSNTKNMCKSC